MRAIITIDPRTVESKKSRDSLQNTLSHVLSFFQPYGIVPKDDSNGRYQYYYADEEAEMRGRSNIALSVELHRQCANFREVALLAQIVLTTATWLDDPCGYAYRCQILSPLFVAKNGDVFPLP